MKQTNDDLATMANQTPIIRFVWLILYQAMADGAEIVIFRMNRKGDETLEDELLRLPRRGEFEIGYQGTHPYSVMAPPPAYLYWPVICRLCCLADVPYWTKGPVSGCFQFRIGSGTDLQTWSYRLQSSDLQSGLTLTRISESEMPADDRYAEIAAPEPRPIESQPSMPAWQIRPVKPTDRLTALVWSLSRCAFYSVVSAMAWALLAAGGLVGGKMAGLLGSAMGGILIATLISWRAKHGSQGITRPSQI